MTNPFFEVVSTSSQFISYQVLYAIFVPLFSPVKTMRPFLLFVWSITLFFLSQIFLSSFLLVIRSCYSIIFHGALQLSRSFTRFILYFSIPFFFLTSFADKPPPSLFTSCTLVRGVHSYSLFLLLLLTPNHVTFRIQLATSMEPSIVVLSDRLLRYDLLANLPDTRTN